MENKKKTLYLSLTMETWHLVKIITSPLKGFYFQKCKDSSYTSNKLSVSFLTLTLTTMTDLRYFIDVKVE